MNPIKAVQGEEDSQVDGSNTDSLASEEREKAY